MRFPKDLGPKKNTTSFQIKKVISQLNEAGDIKGVALIEGNDYILAYDFPKHGTNKVEIQNVLKVLKQTTDLKHNDNPKTYFANDILNYEGSRVIATKLKDNRTLLVMLHKQGYVSLVMRDIENSIGMIDKIMKGYIPL